MARQQSVAIRPHTDMGADPEAEAEVGHVEGCIVRLSLTKMTLDASKAVGSAFSTPSPCCAIPAVLSPSRRIEQDHYTLLHTMCQMGEAGTVELLVAKGADVEAKDKVKPGETGYCWGLAILDSQPSVKLVQGATCGCYMLGVIVSGG